MFCLWTYFLWRQDKKHHTDHLHLIRSMTGRMLIDCLRIRATPSRIGFVTGDYQHKKLAVWFWIKACRREKSIFLRRWKHHVKKKNQILFSNINHWRICSVRTADKHVGMLMGSYQVNILQFRRLENFCQQFTHPLNLRYDFLN